MPKKEERTGTWWRQYTARHIEEEPAAPKELPKRDNLVKRTGKKTESLLDPWGDADELQSELDNKFRNRTPKIPFKFSIFPHRSMAKQQGARVQNTKRDIRVAIELPGMKKEDIKIRVEGRNLIITATQQSEKRQEREGFASFSTGYKRFQNIIPLPAEVDQKEATAKYDAGILYVSLKKLHPDTDNDDGINIE